MDILNIILKECKKANISLEMVDSDNVSYNGIECSGYFSSDLKVIKVAKKRDDWLDILIHEYCHCRQWIEKENLFMKLEKTRSIEIFDNWLTKKVELSKEEITLHINKIVAMELDC
jgi:hypothetical protein